MHKNHLLCKWVCSYTSLCSGSCSKYAEKAKLIVQTHLSRKLRLLHVAASWLGIFASLFYCTIFCHISCGTIELAAFCSASPAPSGYPPMDSVYGDIVTLSSSCSTATATCVVCVFAIWQIIINFPLAMTTNISVWHVWKYLFSGCQQCGHQIKPYIWVHIKMFIYT